MANTRLALRVDVMAGNETAPLHRMPGLWAWRDTLPQNERPSLLRGDVAYGHETVLREAEIRHQPYLSQLKLSAKVKTLIQSLFRQSGWEDAGQGWEGLEDTLTLSGWSCARRVVVLRRRLAGEMMLTEKEERQGKFAFIEGGYLRRVTSTRYG